MVFGGAMGIGCPGHLDRLDLGDWDLGELKVMSLETSGVRVAVCQSTASPRETIEMHGSFSSRFYNYYSHRFPCGIQSPY